MDIVQGGMFNVKSTIKTQFSDGLRSAKVTNQNWSMMDNHCFIPTVSALGFKNPSFHWNATINTRDLVKTGEIPFDNYYIPSHNQDHVSLTKESVAWVMGQLNGNYYNQTGEFVITGPTTVCDQATYTVKNLPPNATVQWSVSNNNLTIVSGQGTGICEVKKNQSGTAQLKAEVSLGTSIIETLSLKVSTEIKVSILESTSYVGCGKIQIWSSSITCLPLDIEGPLRIIWTLESKDQRFFGFDPDFTISTTCKRSTSNTVS